MGIKKLALSFENINVRFCFLPRLFLLAICNQSVHSPVVVYVVDSEVQLGHNPLENVGIRDPMACQPMSNGSDSVSVP